MTKMSRISRTRNKAGAASSPSRKRAGRRNGPEHPPGSRPAQGGGGALRMPGESLSGRAGHAERLPELRQPGGRGGRGRRSLKDRQAGGERLAGSARSSGSERQADSDRHAGSERQAGSERHVGSVRHAGSERRVGSERQAGSARHAGSERRVGSERQAGSERHAGSERQAGSDRLAGGNSRAERPPEERPAPAGGGPSVPVKPNGEYIAEVVGLGHEGEGVGRVDGFTLFIPGALPGERVRVRAAQVKKQYGRAELLEVLKPSPDREQPPCPIYAACGGCQLQHLSYEAQLRYKRKLVADTLERIGKLRVAADGEGSERGVVVHPTLGMPDPWRYRNKAHVPIGWASGAGGLVGGFYARSSHRIVDTDACLIQHERNDAAVAAVKQIARELGIRPYDPQTGRGLLRHVVVRHGFNTGETMVVLITNGDAIARADELTALIRQDVPGIASICQNVNTSRTSLVFGEQTKVLWGRDVIYDTIGDIRFAISARSFFQVNPVQTEALYAKALEYAALNGNETVIDAYCGIGTISLFLARRAGHVYGVEIVPEAIDDARRNALLNGIRNVTFATGAAEQVIPAWREQGIVPDVIVVDPPRKGCDRALLETILAMRPRRVVYVSCDPATLARDLRILEDGGYRTLEAQPVDMFPQTGHVECVVGIYRKDLIASHVR